MPANPNLGVLDHLRKVVLREAVEPTDAELLGRLVDHHDGAAVASLIRRHGPMVWSVCRRVLANHHDAEDAFQATFLVLLRKAATVRPREMVGSFLYGVARQAAVHVRRTVARRRTREVQVQDMPESAAMTPEPSRDLVAILDEEIARLPDIYRSVLVTCELEGHTRKEAARQLAVPEGTVAGRLARARALLAKRLAGRGVLLPAGALGAVLAQDTACAVVPSAVIASTIRTAALYIAGQAVPGLLSPAVASATRGVLKMMLFGKLKTPLALVLTLGLLCTGGIAFTTSVNAGGTRQPEAQAAPQAGEGPMPAPEKREEQPFTAWGKEVGGLQAGLGFHPGQKRAYTHGETVELVVRIRNVSKRDVKFEYYARHFQEISPEVSDRGGELVPSGGVIFNTIPILPPPTEVKLSPGKDIALHVRKLELKPEGERDDGEPYLSPVGFADPLTLYGTGTFHVRYERVLFLDPALSELGTGNLELQIKAEPREKEPEVQEVFPLRGPFVYGPLLKEEGRPAGRKVVPRKDAVGRRVTVEGLAWGQPFGLEGQKGTISPHAGPHVIHQGGSVFVKGIDFTRTRALGKPVRVTGTLRLEPRSGTNWGDIPGYYYIEATTFEPLDAVTDPFLVLADR